MGDSFVEDPRKHDLWPCVETRWDDLKNREENLVWLTAAHGGLKEMPIALLSVHNIFLLSESCPDAGSHCFEEVK